MRPLPHQQEETSAHVGTDGRFPHASGQIFRMRLIFVIVSGGVGFVFFYFFFHFLSFHNGVCLISILLIVKFSCKATCFMTTKLKFFNW